MSLKDWLVRFKAQHEQARAGSLSGDGLADYRAGRDELARALLGAQTATLKAGDVFHILPGKVHNATNNGTVTAKLAAVFVAEKGKPLTTKVE